MGASSKRKAAVPAPEPNDIDMSDAESGMSGDEDSAVTNNEEKSGPSEPVNAPGVFHAPTTQELVELREGS
ncbi:hypothetical protein FRC11_002495, partial [Ceratobasidium sp. 423]